MWYDNWNNFSSFHGNWYLSAKTGLMYNMIPGVTPLIYFNCEDEFMSLGCELYKKYLRNSGRWLNLRNTVKHTEDLKIYTFRLQSFFNSSFHYKFIFKLSFRMQWIQLYFFSPKIKGSGNPRTEKSPNKQVAAFSTSIVWWSSNIEYRQVLTDFKFICCHRLISYKNILQIFQPLHYCRWNYSTIGYRVLSKNCFVYHPKHTKLLFFEIIFVLRKTLIAH